MVRVWVNGQADSKLEPTERGFAYGDGLFATMAVDSRGQLRFLDTYLQRLGDGARRLGFEWHASAALLEHLTQLAQQYPLHCIKLQLSRGVGGRGYTPPLEPTVTEVVSVSAIPAHYADWRQQGIRLAIAELTLASQPKLAGIKHCNRLEQVLIKSVPLPENTHDWLVLDQQHNVIESSMANLFALYRRKNGYMAVFPDHCYAGVAGVMREQVTLALIDMGIDVSMQTLTLAELQRAEHLLLCNSLLGVVDVLAVGSHEYDAWAQSSKLKEKLVPQ